MGTWWTGIGDDDLVPEVREAFREYLKKGLTCKQATDRVLEKYADSAADEEKQNLISIALAELQWKYGNLDQGLFRKVQTLFESDAGLSGWPGISEKVEQERRRKLKAFLSRLQTPNPKPLQIPESVVFKPPFNPGDCLCISLSNGQFGAALVLAADLTHPELGRNLIGVLNYKSAKVPPLEEFKQRRWLRVRDLYGKLRPDVCWYGPGRFQSEKHRFKLVGQIKLTGTDPKNSNRYAGWTFLGQSAATLQTQPGAT